MSTTLYNASSFDESKRHIEKYLGLILLYRDSSDLEFIEAYNEYGAIESQLGNYEQSKNILSLAVDLLRKYSYQYTPLYLNTLTSLASVTRLENSLAAIQLLKEIISIGFTSEDPDNFFVCRAYSDMAKVYIDLGPPFDSASSYIHKGLRIQNKYLQFADSTSTDYWQLYTDLLSSRMTINDYSGQMRDVIEDLDYYEKILQHANLLNTSHHVGFLRHSVEYFTHAGLYHKAKERSDEALALSISVYTENSIEFAWILELCGELDRRLGNYPEAIQKFKRALDITSRLKYKKQLYQLLSNVGDAYVQMGLLNESIKYYGAAQKGFKGLDSVSIEFAGSLQDLANVMSMQKDFNRADSLFQLSLHLFKKKNGTENRDYKTCLHDFATYLSDRGEYKKATIIFNSLLNDQINEPSNSWLSSLATRGNLAGCYMKLGRYHRAAKIMENIAGKLETSMGTNSPQYTNSLFALAKCQSKTGNTKEAFDLFLKAVEIDLDNSFRLFTILSEADKIDHLDRLTRHLDMLFEFSSKHPQFSASSKLYDYVLTVKDLIYKSNKKLINHLANYDTALSSLYTEWVLQKQIIANAAGRGDKRTDSFLIDEVNKANELERQLISRSKLFEREALNITTNSSQIKYALNEKDAAIEFISFAQESRKGTTTRILGALLMKKNGDLVLKRLCSENKIFRLARKFNKGNSALTSQFLTDTRASHKLYKLIWRPLSVQLKNIDKVYYACSSILNQIPLASLSTPNGGFLISDLDIIELRTTKDILQLKMRREADTISSAVLFGGINFNSPNPLYQQSDLDDSLALLATNPLYLRSDSTVRWASLPGSAKEVKNIFNILKVRVPNISLYRWDNASESTFKSITKSNPQIIHVATHGFYRNNTATSYPNKVDKSYTRSVYAMVNSGLVFSNANTRADLDGDDGILTAYEVESLDLNAVTLIVLSACETGLGNMSPSDGVYGLTRAFGIAGTRNILTSVWKIPDRETSAFMTLFYEQLVTVRNIHLAFRNTQLIFSKAYPPFVWSAFKLLE